MFRQQSFSGISSACSKITNAVKTQADKVVSSTRDAFKAYDEVAQIASVANSEAPTLLLLSALFTDAYNKVTNSNNFNYYLNLVKQELGFPSVTELPTSFSANTVNTDLSNRTTQIIPLQPIPRLLPANISYSSFVMMCYEVYAPFLLDLCRDHEEQIKYEYRLSFANSEINMARRNVFMLGTTILVSEYKNNFLQTMNAKPQIEVVEEEQAQLHQEFKKLN